MPLRGTLLHLGFHLHADAALGRVGLLRRAGLQQRRHRRAEVVDIARQHEGGAQALRQVHALPGQRQGLARPARVGRVQRMQHHLRAGRLRRQARQVLQGQAGVLRAGRQGLHRRAARLRQHVPAGGGKGFDGGAAEAAVGAEHEHAALGGVHGGAPGGVFDDRQSGRGLAIRQLPIAAFELYISAWPMTLSTGPWCAAFWPCWTPAA
jgi:hypothetical protein